MADKSRLAVLVMACLQIAFLILEMVLWDTNIGHEVAEKLGEPATRPTVWAANQGLYNGFLAAGLIWGVAHRNAAFGFELQVFFLLCILAAGLYGAYSVKWTFLVIQALPAVVALTLLLVGRLRQPALKTG